MLPPELEKSPELKIYVLTHPTIANLPGTNLKMDLTIGKIATKGPMDVPNSEKRIKSGETLRPQPIKA